LAVDRFGMVRHGLVLVGLLSGTGGFARNPGMSDAKGHSG
jgi:hypothetical protein